MTLLHVGVRAESVGPVGLAYELAQLVVLEAQIVESSKLVLSHNTLLWWLSDLSSVKYIASV